MRSFFLFVLPLAFAGAGLRLFEPALGIDGPLYAELVRRLAVSGISFCLQSGVPDFQPFFAEHPPLGFWFFSVFFKGLGANDFTARLPNFLLYVAFLSLIYHWAVLRFSKLVATLCLVLLWLSPAMSAYVANAYLDPGLLLFGTLSIFLIFEKREAKGSSALAGFLLGIAFLWKGFAFLPFLGVGLIGLGLWFSFKRSLLFLFGFVPPLLGMYLAMKQSACPEYFNLYWARQWTGRFSQELALLDSSQWGRHLYELFIKSFFLAPLLIVFTFHKDLRVKYGRRCLPFLLLLVSHFVFFVALRRLGYQYNLYLLPWIFILSALVLSETLLKKWNSDQLQQWAFRVAVLVLIFVQYFPVPVRKQASPLEVRYLEGVEEIFLECSEARIDFLVSSPLLWYPKNLRSVKYLDNYSSKQIVALPQAEAAKALIVYHSEQGGKYLKQDWESKSWCVVHESQERSLLKVCNRN